ncbi:MULTISPECIES: sulfite exporter TauE/SafE family protein [Paenibacillus]|uniref:sulfite exporter TauE/SafE family protein n=1 Tax=Paenibacillus TaxID=44249 RepID=UPI002FE1C6AA
MLPDINLWTLLGMLVILLAGFVQGVTSFGFALVSLPLLFQILPVRQTVPVIVVLSLLTNISILSACYKHLAVRKVLLLILSGIAAAPFGTYLLVYISETWLKVLVGGLILLFAAIMLLGRSFPVRSEKLGFVTAGLASGLLNGSISMSGPPVALFLSNQGTDKQTFRANLTFYALVLNIVTIISYSYNGLLDKTVTSTLAWTIPAMITGVVTGIWAGSRMNERFFRKTVLVLIIISGLWTIITGIGPSVG